MRTKALLGLAALAVSAATCVAQSNVYSLNIVGYVNVPVQAGLNLLANPLKPSDGNYNITNTIVLPDNMDSAEMYRWTGTGWSSDIPVWIASDEFTGWFSESGAAINVSLGEAFFLRSPAAGTVTFVGEVQTGDVSYSVNPGINVIAPKTPVAEAFPGADVGNDGDNIYPWTGSAWGEPWSYIESDEFTGWFRGDDATTGGPVVPVGSGVVYQNTGSALNWTRTFNP